MKQSAKDYRFDWYPKIPTEIFEDTILDLTGEIDQKRSSRGQRPEQVEATRGKERKTIEQFLIALYHAYYVFPIGSGKVSVPLTSGHYSGSGEDPGKVPNYSFRIVSKVIDALEGRNWIRKERGIEIKGVVTRICASGDLINIFNKIGYRWFPQIPISPKDLVVLRNYKNPEGRTKREKGPKVNLPVPESPSVDRYRSSLYEYNQFLTKHCVALDLDDDQLNQLVKAMAQRAEEDEGDWWTDKDQRINHLDLSRTQLRRIFSRGSMEKGGRFYGGWWQSIPSVYRPHITIDGKLTCEVDFSQISLRIIYAEQGIEIPVDDDLYHIGLPDWKGTDDPRRKPIKTFINAILNDESGGYRLSPEKQGMLGIDHTELTRRVHEQHKAIAHLFNTGIGLHTQFIDSQIAELVMHEMMSDLTLVLPIHDSFIVRAGFRQYIEVVMREAFHEVTGGLAGVDSDWLGLKEHFGMSKERFNEEERKHEEDPSLWIVNLGDAFRAGLMWEESIMLTYVGSWEAWRHRNGGIF
jgi:hypothetical protein